MTRSPSGPAALIQAIQSRMNRVKDSLGLPRSIAILGPLRGCPILVALLGLALVAVGVIVFG